MSGCNFSFFHPTDKVKYEFMHSLNTEKEFVTLIELHKGIIYKICYMYSSGDYELNDLYQEVIVNLWKAFPNFRNECKFSTWIYRIGLNVCISCYRKTKFRPEVVPLSMEFDIYDNEEDTTALLNEMYRLISRLNPMEKALILLWLEEKSYQEISDITGIKKGNVAVKLNRIKEKLKLMSNC